ncbi:hypothetical protein ACFQGE_13365 [Halomicroarcula sp. GCM10025817]|uniref:hypothetical protein n=1 Tax=Haloarcula TaxID=2237 RepID=UPI0023E78F6D|nr:hypothetical protein [Halomicroarcula sp. SYNS111]
MNAIPGPVDADAGPPTTIPLAHFVVGLGFLLAGVAAGLGGGRAAHLAQVHLLLAGWVCLTILGAMTQFVPVWTGTALHSRRLAAAQLPLSALGFAGLAAAFLTHRRLWLPVAGALALAGVWTFVYNVGRSLPRDEWDVTTRHFAVALGFFVLVTVAGAGLALDRAVGLTPVAGVTRGPLLAAHATLAVFGAVLTTVTGALAQLGPMFTQASDWGPERTLLRAETVGYPLGVVLLAAGRLFGVTHLARLGGLLVAAGLCVVGAVLAARLVRGPVEWSPMLTRYAVVALSLLVWAPIAALTWWRAPLSLAGLFGGPAGGTLLLAGVVGFTVFGTLYHVVPFLVWVDRYSDRVGLEAVPTIDDLYDGRLSRLDATALVVAGLLSVAHEGGLAIDVRLAGGIAFLGTAAFAANMLSVLAVHDPRSPVATEGDAPDG